MPSIDRELSRYRRLLGTKIREQGFTYLEVQDALGWGKNSISQLVHGHRKLKLEQVYLVLNVIGLEPDEFFGKLYAPPLAATPEPPVRPSERAEEAAERVAALAADLRAVARALVDRGVIESHELAAAVVGEDAPELASDDRWERIQAETTTQNRGGKR